MTQNANLAESQEMPTSPESLMAHLRRLGVEFTFQEHKPVFTVAESKTIDDRIPGTHCRNLFLRDKKKNNFLVVLQNSTDVDIKKLPELIGSAANLSFGSAERLWEFLGVRPGSVCPYAIINDKDHQVKICLDKSMMETEWVNYHPLLNSMTIGVKPADLITFIESCGHVPHIVDFGPAAPDQTAPIRNK